MSEQTRQTDPRKGGVWGDHTRAGAAWTDEEDAQLISWGRGVGYDFVAGHDLGREPCEGTQRIAWLRANKPKVVDHMEAEFRRRETETAPPDMRRKENRRRKQ